VEPEVPHAVRDNFSINLTMADGSLATILYTSIGDPGLAKERIEISGGGRSAVIDDFLRVDLWCNGKCIRRKGPRQDKGQVAEVDAWARGLKSGASPIPFDQVINVHRACLAAIQSMGDGNVIRV